MAEKVIEEINKFRTFKFDKKLNRVINLKNSDCTNIDEFMEIQNLLDNNRIIYSFEKNFEIQIIK